MTWEAGDSYGQPPQWDPRARVGYYGWRDRLVRPRFLEAKRALWWTRQRVASGQDTPAHFYECERFGDTIRTRR